MRSRPSIRAVGRKGARNGHVGEKKETDLFVNRVALSENKVAAEQPRKKGIVRPLFPAVQLPLEKHECLIDRDEFAKIRPMQLRRVEDAFEARPPAGTRKRSAPQGGQNGREKKDKGNHPRE